MFSWFRNRRRKKILANPWPEPWDLHLQRNVRLTWEMSDLQMRALQDRVKVFVAEKNWEGCEGLQLTEEMQVTIAAQACLMLLGVNDWYFDNVKTILVYPQAFRRMTGDGLTEGHASHRAGEAWQGGPIILSWKDSLSGGRNEDDGQNVVIHEFAHALDGIDGEMGGSVMFDDAESTQTWSRVVEEGYAELVQAKETGRRTLLDHYGATNEAEYFAVATETFFEQPREMSREYGELFSLLKKYFRLDPIPWQRTR
ncbi:M90 family metallopeptidase [Mariniblastus fucicola]|uniref:Protein MtfA n=1 Tax=Mariniblastus fucicola TaxID=980251 RepID=A0A5B9PJ33_9BACT|nr:M90 family metallopeptidase [Mariniblastus fucicola]QEG25255.1 Protein MtfA [Mariniblastus fucicola]